MKKTGKIINVPKNKITKKNNVKKVTIAYIIGIIVIIYFVYCIIQLIKQPTDIVAIENGNLSEEESSVRVCNTRRNSGAGK